MTVVFINISFCGVYQHFTSNNLITYHFIAIQNLIETYIQIVLQIDVFVLLYFIAAELQMLDVLNILELSNYAYMWKK